MTVHPKPADFAAVATGGDVGVAIRVAQWLNGDGFKDYEHALTCVGPELIPGPNEVTETNSQDPTKIKSYTINVKPGEVWVQVLEAEPGGARIRYRKVMDTDLWSTDIIKHTPSQVKAASKLAQTFVGTTYSALVYVALALHRFHISTPGLQAYIAKHKQDICSQMVDEFQLQLGVHLFTDNRWPGDVDPEDLANLLLSKQKAPK